ncbi:hypothetical protein JF116_09705 [Campylobacter fetus subsp. venerealis]|uniref:hypothetical protein n=1 Tax=Campylobacter fetus TaxID=196 RepID=UPI00190D094F|nr:hypothetical protein [Campylobacter fetus]MBK3487655.1 hypothetical protein [Campylobacter fetus subsp. venerealis]
MKILIFSALIANLIYAMPLSQTNALTKEIDKTYKNQIIDMKKSNELEKNTILNEHKTIFLLSKRNKLILNDFSIENAQKTTK